MISFCFLQLFPNALVFCSNGSYIHIVHEDTFCLFVCTLYMCLCALHIHLCSFNCTTGAIVSSLDSKPLSVLLVYPSGSRNLNSVALFSYEVSMDMCVCKVVVVVFFYFVKKCASVLMLSNFQLCLLTSTQS